MITKRAITVVTASILADILLLAQRFERAIWAMTAEIIVSLTGFRDGHSRCVAGFFIVVLCATVSIAGAAGSQPSTCSTQDSASAAATIRGRLAQWVTQVNSNDPASSTIWATPVKGWFPGGQEFSDSAAYSVAGLTRSVGPTTITYAITVDEVAVAPSHLAAVHDSWTEIRHFPGTSVTVSRQIRGSELWRCQPDGSWRIARWVSAPEHWVRS